MDLLNIKESLSQTEEIRRHSYKYQVSITLTEKAKKIWSELSNNLQNQCPDIKISKSLFCETLIRECDNKTVAIPESNEYLKKDIKSVSKKHLINIKSEDIYRQFKMFKEANKCKNHEEAIELLIQQAYLKIEVQVFNKLKEFRDRTNCDSINDAIKKLLKSFILNEGMPEVDETFEDYFDKYNKYQIDKERRNKKCTMMDI